MNKEIAQSGGIRVILACEEHIERALEDYTMEHGKPPDLYKTEQLGVEIQQNSGNCAYCDQKAAYVVKAHED